MQEFDIIAKYFQPLTNGCHESLSLKDDAAIIPCDTSNLVITQDTIIESVHFLPQDTASDVAKKLLRVNLSDLAAMGATPLYYMLAMSLPKSIDEKWIEHFSASMQDDIKLFGGSLIGGDTTSHDGKITLTLTAIGKCPDNKALKRSTAKTGDLIFVTGTIGDSFLGLQILKQELPTLSENEKFLSNRYKIPQPRLDISQSIIDIATSAADISDGLISDLEHICSASNVGATINIDAIPLSKAAKNIISKGAFNISQLATGGDDYELIFTANTQNSCRLKQISQDLNIKITEIGKITNESGVTTLNNQDSPINTGVSGYNHFKKE